MVRYASSIVAGVGGTLIALSFLARTEMVAGRYIADKVAKIAEQRNVSIEIGGMNPTGFIGVQFTEVAISAPIAGQQIDAYFDHVNVFPTLTWPPTLDEVEFVGGRVTNGKRAAQKKSKQARADVPTATQKPAAAEPPPIRFAFTDVEIAVPFAKGPVTLGHVRATVRGRTFDHVSGYGTLPDRSAFALESSKGVVTLSSERDVSINRILESPLPFESKLESIQLCVSCDSIVSVNGVSVVVGNGRVSTPSIEFSRENDRFRIKLAEVAYDQTTARIVDWKAEASRDFGTTGTVKIANLSRGTLEFNWDFSPADAAQIVRLRFDDFPLNEWSELNPIADLATGETLNGVVTVERNSDVDLISTHVSLQARNALVHIDRLSKDPITLPRVGLDARAIWDRDGQSWSVHEGALHLASSSPISFRGRLIGAEQGASFFARVDAPRLNAVVVRDALPDSMTRAIEHANIDGEFAFWFELGGHTAFPDGLYLDGDIGGHVSVLDDNPDADVTELLTTGRPQAASGTGDWTQLSSLPSAVVNTLLAAEDAQFYQHRGFDWNGFKRAMVHNLKRGKLERGASTLTQQVVKNLYLDGERTIERKVQEMYLTWRIESEVDKARILEIYLNIANWGQGVHGIAEAAAHYFGVGPADLEVTELALLMAILPNPKIFGTSVKLGKFPTNRVEKFEHILNNLRFQGFISQAQYREWMSDASAGVVGRLRLKPCDDGTTSRWVVAAPDCRDL